MAELSVSSSLEDYLEAIAEIIEQHGQGHAHAKAIAERLKVTMPSVSNALQSLSARGLIRYQVHAPVELTASGAERAAVIRRRHEALQNFFAKVLFLEDQEASDAACRVEHVIGEKEMSRMVLLSETILNRPELDALRNFLAKEMPEVCPETAEDLISLNQLPEGMRGVVVMVGENLKCMRKFADLGLVRGTLVEMEGGAPFGDLLRIKVMGSSLSMRGSDASNIWVRPAGNAKLKKRA